MKTPSSTPHWLARSVGSAAITPTLLLLAVAATLWGLGSRGNAAATSYGAVIALSLVLVALGCAALVVMRPLAEVWNCAPVCISMKQPVP